MTYRKSTCVGFLALCALASASGQSPVPQSHGAEAPVPSRDVATLAEQRQIAQRFISERLAVWQPRLKLEDWHISVILARRSDLKPKTLGGTRWDKDKKSATIWVLDPADYNLSVPEMLSDMELTTVHELVHLELASLPRSEASRSNEEHAVNRLAEALLNLDKQK